MYPTVNLDELDLSKIYLHYTNINNLENIFKEGLIPQIGNAAFCIEKTKKVFFTIGIEGALVLMDSWIRGLIMKLSVDMPGQRFDEAFYKFSTFIAKIPLRPNFLINGILKYNLKSKKKITQACQQLKSILDDSVYLVLDLQEEIDFSFNDIDEIKCGTWDKKLLDIIYSYGVEDNKKQEYWNMHTFSNKCVEKEKIKLLQFKNSINANKIVQYLFYKSNLKKEKVPYLYEYMKYIEFNK